MKSSYFDCVRKSILFIIVISCTSYAFAQNEVAIGSATTKSNAILWLNGNGSQGLILPIVTNKSAVSNPDKGMIVYDDSDNKVWYRTGTSWVEVGGSSGTGTTNSNLFLQGNQLQLRDGSTVLNSINIAAGTQANGSFMVFQSGSWQYGQITDATGTGTSFQITGLRGKSIATLPASAQALVYDPAANSGNGGWIFQNVSLPTLANGQILTGNGTVNSATTLSGDATLAGGVMTISNSAVTSAKIADATIIGADIAGATITADKLAQSAATTGQVLKWNGTNWVPQNDDSGSGTIPTLSNGQIVVGNGTTNSAATLTGDASLSGATLTISNNAVTTAKINAAAVDGTKLADNSVSSTKIADATITGADIAGATITADKLAQSAATTGQVLKWNGTNWVPQNDDSGSGTIPTLSNGQIVVGNGTTNSAATLTGDATLSGGTLTISNNAITTTKINAAAVDGTKLADNSVSSAKIADAAITGADIANNTITANKLAQSGATNSQVLQWNGTAWVPATVSAAGGVTQVDAGTGLTGGPITSTGTISIASGGVGATQLADNAVTTTKMAIAAVDNTRLADNAVTSIKISDGTITAADIAATTITADKLAQSAATSGQVLKWNGTNWAPAADDAGVGATPTLSNGQILTGNGTTNSASTLSGDATLSAGVLTISNDAITSAKIADGSITNADVSNTAAIAGSKITPGFGAQNISTTGTLTAGATTVTGLTIGTSAWPANASGSLTNNGSGTLSWVPSLTNPMTTQGDIIYGGASGTSTRLPAGTGFLKGGSTPSYSAVNLASGDVSGVLPIAQGGTGLSVFGGGLLYASSPTTIGDIGNGTSGQMLLMTGTSPSWQSMSGDATIGGTGVITISNTAINDAKVATGISGSKIIPSFGAQNISTTGTLTAGATTVTGLTIGTSVWPVNASGVLTNNGTGTLTWESFSGWSVTGNAGTTDGTNFIGTTDNVPLNFRVFNQRAGRIEAASATANSFYGYRSGNVNTGNFNAAVGYEAMLNNTTGRDNAAVGYRAMLNNTTGFENAALGRLALESNTTGIANTAIGSRALNKNTASENTAVGTEALFNNTTAGANTAVGVLSLAANTAGFNSALGAFSMQSNTTGTQNAALGYRALISNTTGSLNTAIGNSAGVTSIPANANTTGSQNTYLGYNSGPGTTTQLFNATAIGANAVVSQNNSLVLGSINGINGASSDVSVGIGTTTPAAKLDIVGTIKITDGTQGVGKVLTSDATGLASWQTLSGGGWGLLGNSGTTAGTNFIGTSDDEPLEVKVNNTRVLRYELNTSPFTSGTLVPNFIGGYFGNSVAAGVKGAVIGGGGDINANTADGDWATIGGGRDNHAGSLTPYAAYATVGGGASNTASEQWSSVGGGRQNLAKGKASTIPGGHYLIAEAYGSTVVGTANVDPAGTYSTGNWVATDPIFIVGNGRVDNNVLTGPRSNAMVILKNGNVGIGTTTPAQTLDVNGNTLLRGSFVGIGGATTAIGSAGLVLQDDNGAGGFGGMYINSNATGLPFYGYALGGASNTWTYLDGTTWKVWNAGDRLSVTSSGNIGIGTTTPSTRLHIAGGNLTVADGTQGTNRMLVSDVNGTASWNGAPGVEFIEDGGGAAISTVSTTSNLNSITVTAPTAGYITVTASGSIFHNLSGTGGQLFRIKISNTNNDVGETPGIQFIRNSAFPIGTGSNTYAFSVTKVFQVAAGGSFTYYFNVWHQIVNGTAFIDDYTIVAQFVPYRY